MRESGFEEVEVRDGPKDEGIDGIGVLQVNPFVSFKVLFQCKRYKGTVPRAQVGDFRNAMIGRADKGIIMTTGSFSTDARKETDRDGAPPVELVDGEKLVEMFENLELGVKPKTVFEVDYTFFKQYMPEKNLTTALRNGGKSCRALCPAFGERKDKNMRIANESDLPAIVSIYNSTIPTRQSTADTVEVTVESRMDWFKQHDPHKRPLMVHEQDNKVVAWVSFQSFYGRSAYDHTAEISIYVSQEWRGKGLGRTLLTEALRKTQQLDIKTLVGFVFSHNGPSMRLFRSLGFEEWGKLPDVAEMDGKEFSLSIMGKRVNL